MSVLAYHMVDTRFDWGITRVTPKQFRRQIEFALNRGFTFQTISEYLSYENDHSKHIAITFDDGYKSIYDYAFKILKQFGIKATLFVIPGFVGQRNTWDVNIGWLKFDHLGWHDIKEMHDAGWEIGSHSMSHRDLTRLDNRELDYELDASKMLLERRLNSPVHVISYPFGNANRRVCEASAKHGYQAGVVMGKKITHVPEKFAVPRIGLYLLDSLKIFEQKIYLKNMRAYRTLQRFIDLCSDGTVVVKQGLKTKK
ncbi:MAG: polysaccharide deacetylase family protein [Calditrichaeota bacterium]|nr:polysaccharide deacetylase family protein [Calditrichota bacterium]